MALSKVLVVEDEADIAKLVKYNVEKAGFFCVTSESGELALEILDKQSVDIVILDIMLPGIDGLETCKRIRANKRTSSVPILMLTAKGEEIDRILGFELGASDYMVKPFSPRELVLRIKAILKREQKTEDDKDILSFDNLLVDISRHKVTVSDKEIKLTQLEFNLLVTFLKRRGRVQSRDNLLEDVWGIAADVTTRTIDTHVKRLRSKLGEVGKNIETVRGIGYKFND